MKALILSGGLGTRLRPLTLDTPKPLLPVGNVPFLAYQHALLKKHSVQDTVLCTADSPAPYREFIRSQKRIGTEVNYSRETKELGTAGALRNALGQVESAVFVFNGDVLTDLDLTAMLEFHQEKKAKITVALVPVPDPSAYGLGVLSESGKILKFIEKPVVDRSVKKDWLINAGIYIFEKEVLELIPRGKKYSTERELFPLCLEKNMPFYGFVANASTYWLDIGTPEKFFSANQDVFSRDFFGLAKRMGNKNKIDPTATISGNVIIGNNCRIGANCSLDNALLLNHVSIDNDVRIEGCIIGNRVKVQEHCSIKNSAVIGNGSVITPFSQL